MLYIGLALLILILWLKYKYSYWKNRNVNGPQPTVFLGNLSETFLLKRSPLEIYAKIYSKYPNEPFVGAYRGLTPVLIVRDLDLIKDVVIKDFNSFHDNNLLVDPKLNPLFGRNPFVLRGEKWKIVRDQITPSMTSGKMKSYYELITENAKEFVKFIERESKSHSDVKLYCSKFTLNNVSTCAMGINANAYGDTLTDVTKMIQELFAPTLGNMIKPFLGMTFPGLSKNLRLRFFSQAAENKIMGIVEEVLKYREKNYIVRNDYLDQMKKYKETCTDYKFTNVDIAANISTLIVDGFETAATVMSFVLHSLATHPEIQEKLRAEILQIGENISYEQLHELPYLDAVFCESLRLFPPLISMTKECTEKYVLEKDNKQVVVDVGTPVVIPIYGLHKDPNYFPDPDVFNPERFLGENKDKIPKCAFIPFGEGRRICIGKRFGILQVKTGIYHVIKNFKLTTDKFEDVKFHALSFVLVPTEPLMIKFTKI